MKTEILIGLAVVGIVLVSGCVQEGTRLGEGVPDGVSPGEREEDWRPVSEPRVCTEGWTDEYRCSQGSVQRRYQYGDCTGEWREQEKCEYGCYNSACITKSWQQTNGPRLEYIREIQFDPDDYDTMYIVSNTGSGILKTTDGGKSWQKWDKGVENFNVFSLKIDPKNPDIMYAGAAGDHLYKTTDRGKTWFISNEGITHKDIAIFSLAIHPDNPDIVFAGQGHYTMGGIGGAVYKSTDSGETWREVLYPGTLAFISSIVIDPKNPDIMYVTTGYGDWCGGTNPGSPDAFSYGVYKSFDGGETWKTINNGLRDYTVSRLTIDPRDSDVLYAATGCVDDDLPDKDCIHRSTDGGNSWQRILNVQGPVNNVIFDNEYNLYASGYGGVYKSRDGKNWESIMESADGAFYTFMYDYVVDPRDSDHQYFGTYAGGIYESKDGGRNWLEINGDVDNGIILANSYGMDIDPGDPDIAYASTIGGFYKTTDGGDNWYIVDHNLLNRYENMMHHQREVVVDQESPNILFVSADEGGAYQSTDYGERWAHIGNVGQATETVVVDHDLYVATAATKDNIARYSDGGWAGTAGTVEAKKAGTLVDLATITHDPASGNIYIGSDKGRLYKTGDGTNWQLLNPDLKFLTFYNLDSSLGEGKSIIAGSNGNGIYIEHWGTLEPRNTKYPLSSESIEYTKVFAVDAYREGNMVAYDLTDSRVYLLHEEKYYSYLWKEVFDLGEYDPDDEVLSLDIRDSLILIGTRNSGLFISKDFGSNWERADSALLKDRTINDIKIDYQDANRIYVGAGGRGGAIVYSRDRGETWGMLNNDLTFTTVLRQLQLQVHPADKNTVYAGTWGGGTYKTIDGGENWVELKNVTESSSCLAVYEKDPNIIYSCDRIEPVIHKSKDGGRTWEEYYRFSAPSFMTGAVAIDPDDPDTIYAGAFDQPFAVTGPLVKITNGIKVADLNVPHHVRGLQVSAVDIEVDRNNPDIIYVANHGYGLFKSTDGGGTWERLDDRGTGLPRIGYYDIDVDYSDSNRLYAAGLCELLPEYVIAPTGFPENIEQGACGIYRSDDQGGTWTRILETSGATRAIEIDPQNPDVLYVASRTQGIIVSTDGGRTWKEENYGLPNMAATAVVAQEGYVYASMEVSGVYAGVVSANGSITWDRARSNKPRARVYNIQIDIDPTNPERIYASAHPGGLLRSDDGGKQWYDRNTVTPTIRVKEPDKNAYYKFTINPANTANIFIAVFGKGIFYSIDYANVAMFLRNPGLDNDNIYDIRVDRYGKYLYASTDGQPSLFRLNIENLDGIENSVWEPLSVSLGSAGFHVSEIVVDPQNPDIIYAVAQPGGVFKTEDGGATWHEKTNGLNFGRFTTHGTGFEDGYYKMEMNPSNPEMLVLGSYDGEIYVTHDGGDTWQRFDGGIVRKGAIYDFKFSSDGKTLYVSQKAGGVSKNSK